MSKPDDPELMLSIWHLYTGGITDPQAISRILGKKIHCGTTKRLINRVQELVQGPIRLLVPVRCRDCGCRINQLPCRVCGRPPLSSGNYREILRS